MTAQPSISVRGEATIEVDPEIYLLPLNETIYFVLNVHPSFRNQHGSTTVFCAARSQ